MAHRAVSSTEVARRACMAPDGGGAVGRRLRLVGGSDVAALENPGLGAPRVATEAAGLERDEAAVEAGGTPCAAASRVPVSPTAARVTEDAVWHVVEPSGGARVG